MIFTKQQVQQLLKIIDYHHLFVISTNFGTSMLSKEDIKLLMSFGVDIRSFNKELSLYDRMYHFGRLTGVLKMSQGKLIEFADFLKFISQGQYIPLSRREQAELEISKRKTYTFLKGLREKAKNEVEGIILEEEQRSKANYQKVVKEELTRGVAERKSVASIVSSLGHRMEDWNHDWGRIVDTEMNNIFQEGRAAVFAEKYGEDVLVYKEVYEGACRHCIEKYLTNGLGSAPRVFKLKDMIAKGTNIGKKVAQWVASLTSLHPMCRCFLRVVPPGYKWSQENQRFELPDQFEHKVERKSKVKITVGDKVFYV